MKTAFVTGGAGFIGSHLSELLLDKGWKVKVLIREGHVHDTYHDIVYGEVVNMLKEKGAEIYYGDLTDLNSFSSGIKGVDVMFHVAGIAYPYHGLPDNFYYDVNTEATKNLAEYCNKVGVKRFLYISSIEAAGPSLDGKPLVEGSSRNPTDAYGQSKKDSEDFLLDFSKKNKMEVTIVRPPMTYGERSPLNARLFNIMKTGFFPQFGKKDAYFEFCYVKNLVKGIYLAGTEKKSKGEVYFISEESYKIMETMKLIGEKFGRDLKIIRIPKKIAYVLGSFSELLNKALPFYPFRGKETGSPIFSTKTVDWVTNDQYICSIDKARKDLGYNPDYAREEGVQRTLNWYKEKGLI